MDIIEKTLDNWKEGRTNISQELLKQMLIHEIEEIIILAIGGAELKVPILQQLSEESMMRSEFLDENSW